MAIFMSSDGLWPMIDDQHRYSRPCEISVKRPLDLFNGLLLPKPKSIPWRLVMMGWRPPAAISVKLTFRPQSRPSCVARRLHASEVGRGSQTASISDRRAGHMK